MHELVSRDVLINDAFKVHRSVFNDVEETLLSDVVVSVIVQMKLVFFFSIFHAIFFVTLKNGVKNSLISSCLGGTS